MVLNHPPIVFIRSYSNWLDSHSDKVEVPGSSLGLRTTFFWRRRITASSLDFQSRHSGPTPGGATTFFRRSSVGRAGLS